MSRSIYDPDEIRTLLARAANLQATERTPDGEGLTIDELKEVARESGIDPRYIELASTEGQLRTQTHWGMPARVSRERWVDGTLDEVNWKTMTKRFTRQFGVGSGTFDMDQGIWESGNVRIVAQQQGGQIHLQAETGWESDFEMPMALAIVSAVAALTTAGLAIVSLEWTIGLVAALFCTAVVLSVARFRKTKHEKAGDESQQLDEALMAAAMLYVSRETAGEAGTESNQESVQESGQESVQETGAKADQEAELETDQAAGLEAQTETAAPSITLPSDAVEEAGSSLQKKRERS